MGPLNVGAGVISAQGTLKFATPDTIAHLIEQFDTSHFTVVEGRL